MSPQEGSPALPEPPESTSDKGAILKYVLLAAAAIYVIASLYLLYGLKTRIRHWKGMSRRWKLSRPTWGNGCRPPPREFKQQLSSEVGSTKQELAARAAELEAQQKAAAARLSAAQNQQSKQIAAVSGEVTDVKTDVGAAKTDIQKTQTDLATTNQKLEKTIGDLGVQSGLVAHNASELEILKHKGDRNYYDFTLQKNARTPISTVSLQLKSKG